jgi:hypothetical protein
MSIQILYSDYYEREFNSVEIGIALNHYLDWCRAKGSSPEVSQLNEIDDRNIDHVLYHAELQGYVIDEDSEQLDDES